MNEYNAVHSLSQPPCRVRRCIRVAVGVDSANTVCNINPTTHPILQTIIQLTPVFQKTAKMLSMDERRTDNTTGDS